MMTFANLSVRGRPEPVDCLLVDADVTTNPVALDLLRQRDEIDAALQIHELAKFGAQVASMLRDYPMLVTLDLDLWHDDDEYGKVWRMRAEDAQEYAIDEGDGSEVLKALDPEVRSDIDARIEGWSVQAHTLHELFGVDDSETIHIDREHVEHLMSQPSVSGLGVAQALWPDVHARIVLGQVSQVSQDDAAAEPRQQPAETARAVPDGAHAPGDGRLAA